MLEDQEKIRLKRLAKLQGSANATAMPPTAEASAPASATTTATAAVKRATAMTTPATPPPVSLVGTAAVAASSSASSLESQASAFEQWRHRSVEHVWQVALDEQRAIAASPLPLVVLHELAEEMQAEKVPLSFGALGQLDRIIVARLQLENNSSEQFGYHAAEHGFSDNALLPVDKSLVDYLVRSWIRADELKRSTNALRYPERVEYLSEIQTLCVSYAGLLLQMPDMFPQPAAVQALGSAVVVPKLVADPEQPHALPSGFLDSLVARFAEEGLAEIAGPWINGLSADMRAKTMRDNYMPPLRALGALMNYKPIATLVTSLPAFNPPGMTARVMELASVLGPFFRLSPFGLDDPKLAASHFGNAMQRTRANVDSAWTSLRLALNLIQQELFQISMAIVRASPESKEALLDWFATVLRKNEDRAKMHIRDRTAVSSEGFMNNIFAVLLRMCDPIMDFDFTKLHLINADYLKQSKRLDLSKLTKLNATPDEEKSYFGEGDAMQVDHAPVNFISELFFLTMSFQHYAIHRTIRTYMDMLRELKEHQRSLQQMKAEQHRWANTPQARVNEAMLKRLDDHVEKMISIKLSFDVVLMDGKFLSRVLQFHRLAMRFFLRVATAPSAGKPLDDPVYAQGATFNLDTALPLPEGPPSCFRMFPEFFIENIAEMVLEVTRFEPMTLLEVGGGLASFVEELLTFSVVFLRSASGANTALLSSYVAGDADSATVDAERQSRSAFIRNPYLVSKFVEVIFAYTWDYGRGSTLDDTMKNVFGTHPVAKKYLVASLIAFYVDVEKTGLSSQFYEKFSIRYNISQILKLLWDRFPAIYQPKVMEESVLRGDTFIKFVNLLMNDTTYLLDEGLSNLAKVHSLQVEIDGPEWAALPQTERAEKEKALQESERKAKSCIQLANETVKMLRYLTSRIVAPFLRPEIIDRLAAMLNYNLVQMVGPKCTELKVKKPEEFAFNPRQLLCDIVDVYLHLSADKKHPEFVAAVGRDGRSYDRKHFEKAASILVSKGVKSERDVQKLLDFVERIEESLREDKKQEEAMGEAPDEFLDPLMCHVMEDPVILPSSHMTVDRSTIIQHLLSDPTDPFNRAPLTIDQVVPDLELKAKISAWKAGALGK